MLLILVLALLFCPSLAEKEVRGIKKIGWRKGYTICIYIKFTIKDNT